MSLLLEAPQCQGISPIVLVPSYHIDLGVVLCHGGHLEGPGGMLFRESPPAEL